jgi:putative ABC transport system permease protein
MSAPTPPPKSVLKFLRWFCREDYLDEVEGNLVELFEKRNNSDPIKARREFIVNVIRHFRPEYLKVFHSKKKQSSFFTAMISNYMKLAFRNLRKRASFSFINILGLALGVCACLVILNYIDFETSYDSFHVNAPNLFRINRTFIQNGEPGNPNTKTTYGLGPKLQAEIPEVKRYIRVHDEHTVVTRQLANQQTISFHEDKVLVADSTFFEAFTFAPLTGALGHALDNPNSIVLTETSWHRYFGYDDAIGKTLQFSGGRMDGLYTIVAIMKDVPENSHFDFDMVIPMHNIFRIDQYKRDDGWGWNNFNTYIELYDGNNLAVASQKLPGFATRWMDPKLTNVKGHVDLKLQPLRDIHLSPGLFHDVPTISPTTIYFFGLIAVFILVIAWINYINLSTARAMERSREVGIKKTIGAMRSELIMQFLFESILINIIAIVLAMIFALLLLPVLSDLIGKKLSFDFTDIRLWMTLVALLVIGTLASGVYPAFVLSSFKISKAIKKISDRGFSLRKTLVIFQFVSSIVLIAGTFLVYRQIKFMQSQDTGLQMNQMLIIKGPGIMNWDLAKKVAATFKNEARRIPGVDKIATSGAVPSQEWNWGVDIYKTGTPASTARLGRVIYIDPDFIPTYDIKIVAGRNYNVESKSDMESVLINEAAVKAFKLGTNEEALSQTIQFDGDTLNIVGVAKDFNWNSLKSEFAPYVFLAGETIPVEFSVHLRGGSIQSSIEALEKLYKDLMPGEPFEYRFLDDTFNNQYKADQQFGNIFGMFAGLAIAICCLGLWGLASFTTSQKLKEIGIRKVLGASVQHIAYLLVRQFILLIGLSAIIAIPLAWYGMDTWLSGFAFRIGLGADLFIVPVLVLTAIALMTIGLQVRRGAVMNPVDVLKTE